MKYLTEEKLKDFRNKFGDLFHYPNMAQWIENEIDFAVSEAQQQVKVEPEVKVQIAEKIKEVIQEKKNNIEEAIRNDDRYMKQCFDSELEAVEDLLERLQASNLSA